MSITYAGILLLRLILLGLPITFLWNGETISYALSSYLKKYTSIEKIHQALKKINKIQNRHSLNRHLGTP